MPAISQNRKHKSEHKQRLIVALITSPTLDHAAKSCGLSRRTVYNWLQQPEFRAELEATKKGMMNSAIGTLQDGALSAAKALVWLVNAPHTGEMTRLGAARTILEFAERFSIAENLDKRIAALEQKAGTSYYNEQPQNVIEACTEIRTAAGAGWTRRVEDLDTTRASGSDTSKRVEVCDSSSHEHEQPGTSFDFVNDKSAGTQEQAVCASKVPVLIK